MKSNRDRTEIVVNRRFSIQFMTALAALLIATATFASPPAKIALKGGRIIPIVGEDIPVGTILIEHGKIKAVGKDVEIPYDAMVVDVTGKVVMPGMIDAHSARGLDIRNENLDVTPFLDVYDAIDPSKLYFEDALRDGITTIHAIVGHNCVIGGLSRAIHPIGITPDEMTQQPSVSLKLSVAPQNRSDRMAQLATFRETFRELAEYLDDLAETKYEESLEKKDEKIKVGPDEAKKLGKDLIKPEDYDDKHRNLVKLTGGQLGAFVYAGRAADIAAAESLAKQHGFFDQTTLVLGPRCYKAIEEIKATGRPVVLDSQLLYREENPITGKITETFIPKVYADAGVAFSLLPSGDTSLAERYLNYQAARCVRNGIARKTALEAITINPARAIGIGDRFGSIEVGKTANVVVMSGDPLDFSSWVDLVYINGIRAYERESDVRLKQLLGEEKPEIPEQVKGEKNEGAPVDPKAGHSKGDADKLEAPAPNEMTKDAEKKKE